MSENNTANMEVNNTAPVASQINNPSTLVSPPSSTATPPASQPTPQQPATASQQQTPQTAATPGGDVRMVPPPAKKQKTSTAAKGAEKPKPVQLTKEELQHASVRVYLEQTVAPLLMDAMQHVARQRPSNPIRAIIQYLEERAPDNKRPAAPPGSKAAQAAAARAAQKRSEEDSGAAGPSNTGQDGKAQEGQHTKEGQHAKEGEGMAEGKGIEEGGKEEGQRIEEGQHTREGGKEEAKLNGSTKIVIKRSLFSSGADGANGKKGIENS